MIHFGAGGFIDYILTEIYWHSYNWPDREDVIGLKSHYHKFIYWDEMRDRFKLAELRHNAGLR